jgi:hypothetical protein
MTARHTQRPYSFPLDHLSSFIDDPKKSISELRGIASLRQQADETDRKLMIIEDLN